MDVFSGQMKRRFQFPRTKITWPGQLATTEGLFACIGGDALALVQVECSEMDQPKSKVVVYRARGFEQIRDATTPYKKRKLK